MSLEAQIRTALNEPVAGIRVRAILEPAAGGEKILPPTYPRDDSSHGPHNMTQPDERGVAAWVSVDSPGSFANRVEEAWANSGVELSPLKAHVAGRTLSTIQLPHRCFDAVLRDCQVDGKPFRKSEVGAQLIAATPSDAQAMLRYDPAVLLLGGWDSTALGMAGGVGNRWPACLSVEISATNVLGIKRAGNRIDPLGIEGTDANLVEEEDGTLRLVATEADAKLPEYTDRKSDVYPRRVKPSRANHGNALSLIPKGVLVKGAIDLCGAISLSRLRRYRFGEIDPADARAFLALMGVYGISKVIEDGLCLRRDCELVADTVAWELVGSGMKRPLAFTTQDALEALRDARAKVPVSEPIAYEAGQGLTDLVARYAG